jgi:acetyl-CoA carboxylase biotin carboxyl carrier protein
MEKLKMDHILKIMEQFEKTSIDTLKYKNDGEEILLTKNKNGGKASLTLNQEDVSQLKEIAQNKNGENKEEETKEKKTQSQETDQTTNEPSKEEENLVFVESPIIGTFYRSPAPGKSPFVKKGDKVNQGDVLCIVEAMKVMNKIESEFSGEIIEVCLDDGQPVEYGTCLFKVRPE